MRVMKSVDLQKVVTFLDSYCDIAGFQDSPEARNGLQFENSGNVTKIATAVDAGIAEFELAAHMGANLLIVHHGMFWGAPAPFVGANYQKIKTLTDSDIAVYSAHLPLDAHPQVGNNVLIAGALGLKQAGRCFEFGGGEVGVLAVPPEGGLAELQKRLKRLFPKTYKEIICGTSKIKKIAMRRLVSEKNIWRKRLRIGKRRFRTSLIKPKKRIRTSSK